ncbi:M14 metallopeptidase family protein [Mucilaginibacter sabulilitoris]|uniref:M14 metallopeptidase family protein n=1 Tax=Mucilaginibacter sabulilitoris TaxID=1173583 RepID=A0ABZ0TQ81_9SPHI|nr:M14 metallopeptidase family protein [Mucilaginibacter sabulilitoris]WPU95278.1 M14 metallopeptidase family protein [Mucilaginibacter sabulilitoris]
MKIKNCYAIVALLCLWVSIAAAQTIPSPKSFFGFNIGDDYQLTNYAKSAEYFKKLAAASNRTKLVDIGLTEEGRHQYMMIISSPANIKNLAQYKDISQKLARAEGLSDQQARALAAKGKAVVWIDGGLHATEVVGAHQLIETTYQLISRKDPETMRILDNVIILMTHANPDGMELVSNWYMKDSDPKKRNLNIPRLYEKYIGHDNNRDFYMMNTKESTNMNHQLFLEWFPQIMYNHHQRGPEGSVLAGPPYRDPFNYVFDPLMITGIDALGAAMYSRLNTENKPGYTRLTGSSFSTWYNGGLRTTTQFHNMIGLLTEIIGGPTPENIPVVPQRLIPNGATPNPVLPQSVWHFRQSIDYSVSLNYAVLDYAARQHDEVLFNIYRMGKNAIERGNEDHWTLSPKRSEAITKAYKSDQKDTSKRAGASAGEGNPDDPMGWSTRGNNIPIKYYDSVLKNPELRDPRGYILPADQPDFPTATKFINALIKAGIQVNKATAEFTVAGKKYPAGSYIVKTAQAFRPHVLDMFEPQDHPNDFLYPGGPPIKPYDAAGWTLAFQMGVHFDRILDNFNGPFQRIPYGQLQSPAKQTIAVTPGAGYLLSSQINNAFIAVNDLLKAGVEVYRLPKGAAGMSETGTFFVPARGNAKAVLAKAADKLGVKATGIAQRPANAVKISSMRIALWDMYGGSIPSGWIRWIMEQYHFAYDVVYPQDVDAGNLHSKYDVIIFVTRGIPPIGGERINRNSLFGDREPKPEDTPAEFKNRLGKITAEKSIPQLKAFLEDGGSIVTIGSSTNLAYHLGLPVHNALVEKNSKNEDKPLPGTKYYVPGSILSVTVDPTIPAAWGMNNVADIDFDNSQVFKLDSNAAEKGVRPIAWFATDKPLRSGWAWGQSYLKDGVAAFVAPVGKGELYAFGPEITFRAQSHGTFKLLFNQLYSTSK